MELQYPDRAFLGRSTQERAEGRPLLCGTGNRDGVGLSGMREGVHSTGYRRPTLLVELAGEKRREIAAFQEPFSGPRFAPAIPETTPTTKTRRTSASVRDVRA